MLFAQYLNEIKYILDRDVIDDKILKLEEELKKMNPDDILYRKTQQKIERLKFMLKYIPA